MACAQIFNVTTHHKVGLTQKPPSEEHTNKPQGSPHADSDDAWALAPDKITKFY